MYYHRVWAEINLSALDFNLDAIRGLLPADAGVMAVVKADAYGHGAVSLARHLEGRPIWGFGVGDSQEALELRASGIRRPILILGAIIEEEIERVVNHDVSVCVHSVQRIERLDREARRQDTRCRVHLMIDTGMGRLGVFPDQALRLAHRIASSQGLIFEGVCTHYSSAAAPGDPFTGLQEDRFATVKAELEEDGIRPRYYHASNSGALFSGKTSPYNLVRPGIALYGISPFPAPAQYPDLQPCLSLKTQILYMKDVPKGTPIGYNRLFVAPEDTRIATIPIGYNDGFPYRLSNKGCVLLRGKRAPVAGAVSMDYTMIDVGKVKGAEVGDHVTLIGRDGKERIRVEEMAEAAGTIPYEITCRIGKRVRRIAVREPAGESSGSAPPDEPPPETEADGLA